MKRLAVRIVDAILHAIDWVTARTWASVLALVIVFSLPELCWAMWLLWKEIR